MRVAKCNRWLKSGWSLVNSYDYVLEQNRSMAQSECRGVKWYIMETSENGQKSDSSMCWR